MLTSQIIRDQILETPKWITSGPAHNDRNRSLEQNQLEILGCAAMEERPTDTSASNRMTSRKKIEDYPFEQVKYRIAKEQTIPAGLINEAVEEFKKFLTVILHADGPVGMVSPEVDEVWHTFILFTRDYQDFCRDVFGRYIHHSPNWPGTPAAEGSVENFLNNYKRLFGELHPFWSNAVSDCDDCGYGKCGVSCYDCNGDNDDDCSTQG